MIKEERQIMKQPTLEEIIKNVMDKMLFGPNELLGELKEQYKKLQNLKGEEQDAAIAALSDE